MARLEPLDLFNIIIGKSPINVSPFTGEEVVVSTDPHGNRTHNDDSAGRHLDCTDDHGRDTGRADCWPRVDTDR